MKDLKLNSGDQIPIVGLGTFLSTKGEVTQAVKDAVEVGYRHFDCAWRYQNEEEVGIGLQAKINDGTVKREDLFIVTKLWNNAHAKEHVVPMLQQQLKNLQQDYVDLYLIHWPLGFKENVHGWPDNGAAGYSDVDYVETWEGMEECVKLGLARNIGISNFNSEQIARLLNSATIKPSVNQIEVNLNMNNKKLIQFCKEKGIVVVGFSPLGRVYVGSDPNIPKSSIFDEGVIAIAEKHDKTPAQIILRHLINFGIGVIPKTVTKKRMIENLDVFDFDLDREDVGYLDSLNKNVRVCVLGRYKDHKYYPFNAEF